MQHIRCMRWMSIFLAVCMMFSIAGFPAGASAAGVTIKDTDLTTESKSVTVNLSQVPSLGVIKIIELDAGETYKSEDLFSYTELYFSAFYNTPFHTGDNTLTLAKTPTAGKKVMAVVRDSSNDDIQEFVSNAVTVKDPSGTEEKTPEEILENTKVQLMKNGEPRTEPFKQEENSVDVSVQLDDTVPNCYLTIFAYAGNTSFDPDSSQNIRLWQEKVTDGYTQTCVFSADQLPLKAGYKIIACLNVPVGEDNTGDVFYRPSVSQALEVVDKSGQGFQDYVYPDVSIDETTLEAGATSLHISLTGDERLFQAAREKKTSITCVVAQYPDGDDFDFESEAQISLTSPLEATEAFQGKEIRLSEPLRAGYRVRAVVYWTQNPDIFLTKGNDYEAVFNRPDDSVLVAGSGAQTAPAAEIEGSVGVDDDSIRVNVSGSVPEEAVLLLKAYDAQTTEFLTNEGTPVAVKPALTAGTHTLTPNEGSLEAGKKLVAFILSGGAPIAQSQPVIVQAAVPFVITPPEILTTDTTQAQFQVYSKDAGITNINIAKLCKVDDEGNADTDHVLDTQYGNPPGPISFQIPKGALKAGDKLCLVLTYMDGTEIATYTSQAFPVMAAVAENSLALQETEFTTQSTQASVVVSGCDAFIGGRLILTVGPADNVDDADSRTQLASVPFTGEGVYTLSFSSKSLKAGQTILPHLYIYDAEDDTTAYQYGAPVLIKADAGQTVEPKVEIATDTITADRTDLWAMVNFDSTLTGTLTLYTYTGTDFDVSAAKEIYTGAVLPSESSQRITFGSGKLTAGQHLIAVLSLSDGSQIQSQPKTIQAAPEKEKPKAEILDKQITAGDTYLRAALTFDAAGADNASYALYQFTGETLDTNTAVRLSGGSLYRSETNKSIYLGSGKLVVGAKLQLVLTVDGVEAMSNVVTVSPSPDWGTPYAAFDVAAVKADADGIDVTIDYSDEYLSLGDDFYCDVTIYQFSSAYTDEEFEENELWENYNLVTRVGQVNSSNGAQTKGHITVPVREEVTLNPGDRLIIKLRLPHTEWDGEEVDYLSVSVPVIAAEDEIPSYKVVLYNLDNDSARGYRVRKILEDLGIPAETMDNAHLNESVGYLAGLEGYEAATEPYTGQGYDTEFMLLCNLPESLLDRFLDAMMENGLRIDHKAVVTEYNREALFYELIADIEEEHDVFQALLALDDLVSESEKLSEDLYGASPYWKDFQQALAKADAVLKTYEPTLDQLQTAYNELKTQYLLVTGMEEITGLPVIDIEKDADGTYTLTARIKNGDEDAKYQFLWSNGVTGDTVTGVAADKLIGTTLTVTAEQRFGELSTQLQVPDAPAAAITAQQDALEIRWPAAAERDNQPAPTEYVLSVYQGETLVQTISVDGHASGTVVEGLKEDTAYTVKLYALSPVGRSDIAAFDAKTLAAGTEAPEKETPGMQGSTPQDSGTEQTRTENQNGAPQTGDRSNALFWLFTAMACIAGTAGIKTARRKSGQNK